METLDLITGSLRAIGVLRVTQAPSAEQGANALLNLNRLMASLAEDGIDLGYAPTTTITDDVNLALGVEATIIAMLALKEASDRGIDVPVLIAETADSGYKRLLRNALLLEMQPASLSTVSHGNGSDSSFNILTGS